MSVLRRTAKRLKNDDFALLTKREYFTDLLTRIPKLERGDRLLLMTHDLDVRQPLVAQILDNLQTAAERGVTATFMLDERTFPVLQRLPATPASKVLIQRTNGVLAALRSAGVACHVMNSSYRRVVNRFAGRSHIKAAIINDDIYIGGCNLSSPEYIDLMARWHDARTAGHLYELLRGMGANGNVRAACHGHDQTFVVDPQTTLLLDAGTPRQSFIYTEAIRLIDEAKEWIVLTCQYFPNSVTAKHLALAYRRGVNVSVYFNHPSKHRPGHNVLHHLVLLHERARHPAALFEHRLRKDMPFLHAKLLATEQAAMIGSHNYVTAGVSFGTAELTLLRRDPDFAREAAQHIVRQLG